MGFSGSPRVVFDVLAYCVGLCSAALIAKDLRYKEKLVSYRSQIPRGSGSTLALAHRQEQH